MPPTGGTEHPPSGELRGGKARAAHAILKSFVGNHRADVLRMGKGVIQAAGGSVEGGKDGRNHLIGF